jgi:NTE family protein
MVDGKRKKIGLALGSGGAKGLAHIGVIKELERNNIPIDIIVGSSFGALVGGFYAATKDTKTMEELALRTNWRQMLPMFFDPALRTGILKGDKFKRFIKAHLGTTTFETTHMPFGAVVTDLSNAKAVCLTEGDFVTAIRASISIPLLLQPVVQKENVYVDGGLSMPVPVEFAKLMGADIVIAVNLFEHYEGIMVDQKFNINTITYKSSDVLSHYLALENVKTADIVVTPNVGGVTLFQRFMTRAGTESVIQEGESAMHANMEKLKAMITEQEQPPIVQSKNIFQKIKSTYFSFRSFLSE